jgi:hypothetical protein
MFLKTIQETLNTHTLGKDISPIVREFLPSCKHQHFG